MKSLEQIKKEIERLEKRDEHNRNPRSQRYKQLMFIAIVSTGYNGLFLTKKEKEKEA